MGMAEACKDGQKHGGKWKKGVYLEFGSVWAVLGGNEFAHSVVF